MVFSISSEEKQKIVKYLISKSPVNEVDKVVTDLRNILGKELSKKDCQNYLKTFYEDNHFFFSDSKGINTVLGEYCKVDDGKYYNSKEKMVVEVDFDSLKVVSTKRSKQETSSSIENFRF
ncbi:F-actin-capping protein [Bonamia ostreae]|uniref:F-actin-capping protein subunit alpha n=1 Tax=Bonamia ostreae TaxID=126728 RepID=A0ABV2AQ71_9EUKA